MVRSAPLLFYVGAIALLTLAATGELLAQASLRGARIWQLWLIALPLLLGYGPHGGEGYAGRRSVSTARDPAKRGRILAGGQTRFFVDQSIQLGDGGWGVIVQGRAFHEVFHNSYAYASGSYLISPRNQTGVVQGQSGPYSRVRVSVPDVYNARAGLSYVASNVVLSLGGRVDGIPMRDLIGRSDGFRRPATIGYVEPALSVTRGRGTYTINDLADFHELMAEEAEYRRRRRVLEERDS